MSPASVWFTLPPLVALCLAAIAAPAAARTWSVNADGTGDAPTIQSAVDQAADGDTIDIAAGFYSQKTSIVNKTLLVRGAGALSTDISADVPGHVFALRGPDNYTEIRDVTIRNGNANNLGDVLGGIYGGGVLGEQATFALVRCRFIENSCGSLGGAVYGTAVPFDPNGGPTRPRTASARPVRPAGATPRSATLIEECAFLRSFAGSEGGAICMEFAFFEIRNCVFEEGFAGQAGGVLLLSSFGTLSGCLFEDNSAVLDAGALKAEQNIPEAGPTMVIRNNTFIRNQASRIGAGAALTGGTTIDLSHNLFAFHSGTATSVVGCLAGAGAEYHGGCNQFWMNGPADLESCEPAAGDANGDPLLCNAGSDDYRLCEHSPALSGPCGARGAFGVGCTGDGCAVAARPVRWGWIKSRVR